LVAGSRLPHEVKSDRPTNRVTASRSLEIFRIMKGLPQRFDLAAGRVRLFRV